MRPRWIGLLAAAALCGSPASLPAEGPDVGELTRELKGEKPAAKRTAEQLDAAYAKVLDALIADLGNEDIPKRDNAQRTLERIAFQASRPGADADRAACAKVLAGRLGPDVPTPARVWILRQIERLGRAEVVAPLAKALGDKDALVRESARRALEKNPSRQAGEALGKAIASAAAPAWRAALVNALVDRRDPANLGVLLAEARSDHDDVRSAAVAGLARIGDKSAVKAVAAAMTKGSQPARRIATDSFLLLADTLVAKGDKATALGMYKSVLTREAHLQCAGIIGLGRVGSSAELPAIFAVLADPDARIRGAGVEALCLMGGRDVTNAIVAKVKTAGSAMKPALLRALALRGETGQTATFLAAAENVNEGVRTEAIRGLGLVGDASAVPLLLKAAAATGKPQAAARESLGLMKAPGVDKALLAALNEKDPKLRAEVVQALSARHATAAAGALLKAAEDTEGAVRNEALKALGSLAGTDCLSAVAALLVRTADGGSRNEAANALVRIAGREADADKRVQPIVKVLESAAGPAKLSLLGVLGRIGGRKSLQAVRPVLKDRDEKVREAAVRALADWPDIDAADDLLAVAKAAGSETLHVIAMRGYIRVVRLRNRRPAATNARMLAAALKAAKRAQEKKQALGGLGEVRDILALRAVVPCMSDNALKEEAAHAAVRIGRDIWSRHLDDVQAAMKKVLDVSKSKSARTQAQEVLDRIEQRRKENARRK